jgi:hypothetical protein
LIRVLHFIESGRAGDIDFVHAADHIHAVVAGAEQRPEDTEDLCIALRSNRGSHNSFMRSDSIQK